MSRKERPVPQQEPLRNPGGEPSKPDIKKPNVKNLLDRMKRVDPKQAERYRQRSGE
jgi:hypothetical protein